MPSKNQKVGTISKTKCNMKFFFTAELSHFLGQKVQKNIFFQFCFLLQNLVTFWGQKVEKNIFLQKIIFLNFLSPKSD